MHKILAFGASNSSSSINKQLTTYASSLLTESEVNLIDLNDYEMPIYGIDKENASGIPQSAHDFKAHINDADGIIISFAEHNGAYTTAFKNIFDWVSRIEKEIWYDKPMLLLATSPGARGGISVLNIANTTIGFANKNVVGHFSLPRFYNNFENGIITNQELDTSLRELMQKLQEAMG